MASVRLPGKPLADIHGAPMIAHVLRRAEKAALGPVWVACAEKEIAAAVEHAGGKAVMTRPDHPSGTDRIVEALAIIDPARAHDTVINVQGDLPAIDPAIIKDVLLPFSDPAVAIATLAAEARPEEYDNPNVVKAVVSWNHENRIGNRESGITKEKGEGSYPRDSRFAILDSRTGKALYFTRARAPHGEGPLWHHIGLYTYRRAALEKFAALPPSPLETREKLEQLRALEAGMIIGVTCVAAAPSGVDTPEDLERARLMIAEQEQSR